MLRFISLTVFLFVYVPAWSVPLPSPLPDKIYFSVSWCPNEEDIAELSKHLQLTMYRCCISEATVLPETKANPEVLAPWSNKIYTDKHNPMCFGLTAKEEAEKAEKERIEEERRLSEAPTILKAMPKDEFCTTYGKALRKEKIYTIGVSSDIAKLVKKESARRKLRFDDSLIRKEQIRMGISECQLYASWGIPTDQNQSVGRWGVHVQHVYGNGAYVYTENGRVTSWQN